MLQVEQPDVELTKSYECMRRRDILDETKAFAKDALASMPGVAKARQTTNNEGARH